MPLPDDGTDEAWPPTELQRAYEAYAVWDAWFAGDTEALQALYATTRLQTASSIWGQVARRFWGTPTPTTTSQRPVKLHVPVAGEIARMSASLLFGDMPTIVFKNDHDSDDYVGTTTTHNVLAGAMLADDVYTTATARTAELLDDQAHARFIEGAEYASAHGGAFLRVSWDSTVVPDRPFITVMPVDTAIPEFRFGRLTAVTFWSTLTKQGSLGYRLLERHEPGTVEFALYESANNSQLGRRVPLTTHPDVADLAALVGPDSTVETGSELITAVYLPNMRPNRKWRKDPHAANLGRSDFDGVEDLMDALDEAYTSWMRDFRLGKTRIMIPKGLLQTNGAGNGAVFNADQEVFTELGGKVGSLNPQAQAGSVDSFIKTFQPTIRFNEHQQTVVHLLERIYAAAGYSAQTFGESGDMAITATEVTSREKLTLLTRNEKILNTRPAIVHLVAALLDVDEAKFGGPGRHGLLPQVEWPDAAAENPQVVAQTLQLLNTSESASIETRVRMLHDDWDEDQIAAEVEKIRADYSMLPDPTMAHLWAAAADNASATGGVEATKSGVTADPAQLAAAAKGQAAETARSNAQGTAVNEPDAARQ